MSVTADDPRYDEWPTRKPTKYQKEAAKFASKPTEFVAERVLRKAHRSSSSLGKKLTGVAGGASTTAVLGAAAASAAILAAAYVVADHIARSGRLALGERLNQISRNFVATQQRLQQQYRAATWAGVPPDVQKKAVDDYKRAIGTANAQAQGTAFAGVRESYK